MTDFRSAAEIATAIRQGKTTAIEVTSAALERIAALDGTIGAFVLRTGERARAVAQARDAEQKAGLPLGPLHGVPVAVKDLFDLAGFRTGAGSRALPDHIATDTAEAITRLEQAGAVVVGKTQMVEFAFGGWGTNPVLGAPRNPHDSTSHRVTGGSSSGSAAAVAAGMVPLAIGTDTGGSIRVPAALCGVVGYKPSPGLISRSGMRLLSRSHDTIGPLCRTVHDAALCAEVMMGHHAFPRLSDALRHPLERGHIAVLDDPALDMLAPDVGAAFAVVLDDLTDMGFAISRLSLPMPLEALSAEAGLIMSAEGYAELRPIVERPDSGVAPEITRRILRGRDIGAAQYLDLLASKRGLIARFQESLEPFDALLAPATPFAAPLLDEVDENQTPLSTFGRFANMLDLCAVAVPMGSTPQGLPVGLQIAARTGQDHQILRLARTLEKHRPHSAAVARSRPE